MHGSSKNGAAIIQGASKQQATLAQGASKQQATLAQGTSKQKSALVQGVGKQKATLEKAFCRTATLVKAAHENCALEQSARDKATRKKENALRRKGNEEEAALERRKHDNDCWHKVIKPALAKREKKVQQNNSGKHNCSDIFITLKKPQLQEATATNLNATAVQNLQSSAANDSLNNTDLVAQELDLNRVEEFVDLQAKTLKEPQTLESSAASNSSNNTLKECRHSLRIATI